MANWFKKMMFEESESNNQYVATIEQDSYLIVDVPVDHIALSGQIEIADIYLKAGLQDTSKSIFKVEQFSKVLPATIPSADKKTALIGILTTSGLEIDSLNSDADQRIGAINSVLEQFAVQTVDIITKNQEEITQLEARIDDLKKATSDRKSLQEAQEKLANEEIEKIELIVKSII